MIWRIAVRAVAVVLSVSSWAAAQGGRVTATGHPRPASLASSLARSVAFRCEDVPLRRQLYEFGTQQGIAVFLDRRIDPDQPIALRITTPQPVGLILHRLAYRIDSVIVPIDRVIYVAPVPHGWRIGATYESLRLAWERGADAAARRRRPVAWTTPGTPRQILLELCRTHDVRLREVDRLPHDLWAGWNGGALPFPAAVTLLIAGFDFEADWQAATRELVIRRRPAPADRGTGSFYAAPGISRNQLVQQFSMHRLTWQRRGPWWRAHGTPQSLSAVAQYFSRYESAAKSRHRNRSRLTFNVRQQPLGAVLKTLEQQLELTFQLTPEAARKLNTRVTFSVRRATLDETLRAIFEAAGLEFQRQGQLVKVTLEPAAR